MAQSRKAPSGVSNADFAWFCGGYQSERLTSKTATCFGLQLEMRAALLGPLRGFRS